MQAHEPTGQPLPPVIQGGMGVAVSGWRLARAVARHGQLGVVSGTALDAVHARRLADGDPGGHLRRAYGRFPVPGVARRVLERWLVPGGRAPGAAYRPVPMGRLAPSRAQRELTVVANFAEVLLAREGHDGPVGINYLEKVQLPTPMAVYGAMLAGVDVVLVGAGIPRQFPRLLTDLARGSEVAYRITVEGARRGDEVAVRFDPAALWGARPPAVARPRCAAIVSSHTLAAYLLKDPETRPDAFVVEGPGAGGHNAPPRGPRRLDHRGQPVYGPRDQADVAQLAAKRAVIRSALAGDLAVRTDPAASPSGFPFKVAGVPATLADDEVYAGRPRVCDLGYLRTAYRRPDGRIGHRCPAEPVETYLAKGGRIEDTAGRRCLCNGLLATAGLAQQRHDGPEPPIVTLGDDVVAVVRALAGDSGRWRAADVIDHVLGRGAGHGAR